MTFARLVLILIFLCALSIILLLIISLASIDMKAKEASIAFELAGLPNTHILYNLYDVEDIEQLIVNPISSAKSISNPEKYVVFGYIKILYDNGKHETVNLFKPFGIIKYRGQYRSANFDNLKERIIIINEVARRHFK